MSVQIPNDPLHDLTFPRSLYMQWPIYSFLSVYSIWVNEITFIQRAFEKAYRRWMSLFSFFFSKSKYTVAGVEKSRIQTTLLEMKKYFLKIKNVSFYTAASFVWNEAIFPWSLCHSFFSAVCFPLHLAVQERQNNDMNNYIQIIVFQLPSESTQALIVPNLCSPYIHTFFFFKWPREPEPNVPLIANCLCYLLLNFPIYRAPRSIIYTNFRQFPLFHFLLGSNSTILVDFTLTHHRSEASLNSLSKASRRRRWRRRRRRRQRWWTDR